MLLIHACIAIEQVFLRFHVAADKIALNLLSGLYRPWSLLEVLRRLRQDLAKTQVSGSPC